LTVQTGATDGDTFRVYSPETNPNVRGGLIARFRSGSPAGDRFRFDQAGGFVAISQIGYGIIPASGCGYRMMWHPFKIAFRAGSTDDGAGCTYWDESNVGFYSWAGGSRTIASSYATFAFGEDLNVSNNYGAAFGSDSIVSGAFGFSTGDDNRCSGNYCVSMGFATRATGQSSVALGYRASAVGDYSVALGQRARSGCETGDDTCTTPFSRNGSFVFGDNSTTAYLDATANNQFSVRAAGGYRLFSNATLTTGVGISAGGGSWTQLSDRNAKENFGAVNSRDVLRKVLTLPISTWSYKGQTYRHIGAMAQDFYAAFKVGENDKTITTVDPDGVALAAIQGLNAEMTERTAKLQAENERLRRELAAQQTRFDQLEERLEKLERRAPRRTKGRK
jgi:hypothetical protein